MSFKATVRHRIMLLGRQPMGSPSVGPWASVIYRHFFSIKCFRNLGLNVLAILFISHHALAQAPAIRQVQYLSGTDNDHTVAWDFFCTAGRKSGYWTTIPVPSCWEQQGFGNYNYGRDYKTYGKHFRFAGEQGKYKYRFTVPASWKNKAVYIVFEGSMTDTEVKINGQPAGDTHQGAFYRFKYEISDKLHFGQSNLLEVTVRKVSADPSVNNAERRADYWIFGGIFRPVYLEAYPTQHIDHIAIDARADGSFGMNVFPIGLRQPTKVEAVITNAAGKIVAGTQATAGKRDSLVYLHTTVKAPLLWTSETPNLYHVKLLLKNGSGLLYETTRRFGFRTIEIRRGDGIYLNGTQIKMKGICRHVWWPETGRTVNPGIDSLDIRLIKEMNMNAVRCSHYPPDQSFLDLCDSLGLYVLDELAGWQQAYDTRAGRKLVREMVVRDANHPSVIFWDNGNEGGTNPALDADFDKYDLSGRPVIHPHHKPGHAFNGIDCNHYEDYYSTRHILSDSLIYMPTEFLHAEEDGGGGAALSDFWELHWHAKRSGGGFIWAFLDEGVARTDHNGQIDVNGLNAPDGVVGPHREKEGSFYAIREIYSPVKIFMQTLPDDFHGDIPVENRYFFTNLDQCRFEWSLVNFRKPGDDQAGRIIMKKGEASAPSVAPGGAKGVLHLGLPGNWKQYDALRLSAYDPFKNSIYQWTWKIKTNEALLRPLVSPPTREAATATETDSSVTLKGGDIAVTFSRKDGRITSVDNTASGPLSFGEGPVLAGGSATLKSIRHFSEKDGEVLEMQYAGDLHYTRWKMYGNGWLRLEYEYDLAGDHPFAGISFHYPEHYVLGAKWLGKGPYRVWKNRLQGVTDNVWTSMYNDTQTGQAPWVYPEFKGYFADITWMELNTVEGKFLVASEDSGLYVRLFDFYGLAGAHSYPVLPPGNLSFLDAIPPVGTMMSMNMDTHTAHLGPSSELNHLRGPEKRTLYFYFGLPATGESK